MILGDYCHFYVKCLVNYVGLNYTSEIERSFIGVTLLVGQSVDSWFGYI